MLEDIQRHIDADTLTMRREFLQDVECSSSADIHGRAEFSVQSDPTQAANRWREKGAIFAVNFNGRDHYPNFQFSSDGQPLPIIAELLSILRRDPQMSDWDIALWFTGTNGWLDGNSPIDWLSEHPNAIRIAAEQETLEDGY